MENGFLRRLFESKPHPKRSFAILFSIMMSMQLGLDSNFIVDRFLLLQAIHVDYVDGQQSDHINHRYISWLVGVLDLRVDSAISYSPISPYRALLAWDIVIMVGMNSSFASDQMAHHIRPFMPFVHQNLMHFTFRTFSSLLFTIFYVYYSQHWF